MIKLGQIIDTSNIPCKECFQFHNEKIIELRKDGNIEMTSWEKDGHSNQPITEKDYIEVLIKFQRKGDMKKVLNYLRRKHAKK